jgi:hypothetical protein
MKDTINLRIKGKGCYLTAMPDADIYALQNVDYPPVLEVKAAIKKVLKPLPKTPMQQKQNPQKQELHKMQSFIIPDFAPNVTEQIIEVDGALVKCTKGVQFEYEKYVPPIDSSRNYTPRPIRWILAGRDHGA